MNRYVCIHGHFYQPPRENPWLESVEREDSAHPYHDWNERIGAECYGPNAFSRILDDEGQIVDIVNNYARISFSFGAQLLAWLEAKMPEVYARILEADREGRKRFNGHGGAMAQPYGHVILPLATRRDKITHIRWGIADFKRRFGRKPEGMWLPERAVDTETLELMAKEGIVYTLLSPGQCARVRTIGETSWRDVGAEGPDIRRPYFAALPSGKRIALFFGDPSVSEEIAFGGLLKDGGRFADRLIETLPGDSDRPRIAAVVSDGESFGHHQHRGDMALAYALQKLEHDERIRLGVYSDYLERFPPTEEVQLHENSSSGCVHGVERWRGDCGCNAGSHPGWHQRWRSPLRNAADWLRDSLSSLFAEHAQVLLKEPWGARDDYLALQGEFGEEATARFLKKHARHVLSETEHIALLELMEMQRNLLLMYTSCGWHFDDISGLEAQQNLLYSSRAMQLARKRFGIDFEPAFMRLLEEAPSNLPRFRTGRGVYEELIKEAPVDNARFAGNLAVSLLYEEPLKKLESYAYRTRICKKEAGESGRLRYVYGIMEVVSLRTDEPGRFRFAAVDLGDRNILAGVSPETACEPFESAHEAFNEMLANAEVAGISAHIHAFTDHYLLKDLFRDIQRAVMQPLLTERMRGPEAMYRLIYETSYPTLKLMHEMRVPPPEILIRTLEYVLNRELEELLSGKGIDAGKWEHILGELAAWGLDVDSDTLAFSATRRLERSLTSLSGLPGERHLLRTLVSELTLFSEVPLTLNMYTLQNHYFRLAHDQYLKKKKAASAEYEEREWVVWFEKLQPLIGVRLP